jgi:hypothetical protein
MAGFGSLAPLPIRLGGSAQEGLSATQHARIAADLTAMHRSAPLAPLSYGTEYPTPDVEWDWESRTVVLSSVTASGTSPPTITASGTPADATDRFRIECTTGGPLGVSEIQWTSNGGATWATKRTAASIPLGSTGVTIQCAAGTYATDNVWTFDPLCSALTDTTGNGYTATQATEAQQPKIEPDGLTLDGDDDNMSNTSVGALVTGTDVPFTVGIVCDVAQDQANGTVYRLSGGAAGYHEFQALSSFAGRTLRRDDTSTDALITNQTDVGPLAHLNRFNGTTADIWANGTQEATAAPQDVGALTLSTLGLGATTGVARLRFRRLAMWARAVSDAEVAAWNAWGATERAQFVSWKGVAGGWLSVLDASVTGSTVAAWVDQTGRHHHVLQDTAASQPSLSGGAYTFDGTSDYLQSKLPASAWRQLHQGATVVIKFRMAVGATGNRALLSTVDWLDTNVGLRVLTSATAVIAAASNGSGTPWQNMSGAHTRDTAWHVLVLRHDISGWDLRLDGSSIGSGSPVGLPSAANPLGALTVGRWPAGPIYAHGDMSHVAINSRYLTTAEVQTIETALGVP